MMYSQGLRVTAPTTFRVGKNLLSGSSACSGYLTNFFPKCFYGESSTLDLGIGQGNITRTQSPTGLNQYEEYLGKAPHKNLFLPLLGILSIIPNKGTK